MKNILSWIALAVKTVCAATISLGASLGALLMTILAFLIGAISFIRQLFVMIQTSLALFLFIATAKTDYLIDILDFFVPTFEDAVLHFIFFVSCLMLVGCVVFIFVGLYLIGSSIFSFAHTFRKECKSKSKAVQKPVTLVPTKATTEEGCTTASYTLQ